MDHRVQISIAMATFNGEKFLRQQLDSIQSQTFKDYELIIGDDCSSDHTLDILKEYAAKDPRIQIIVNKTNLGFKKNFENILSKCTGAYIAFCDQDDIWENNHLEFLYFHINQYDCIGCNANFINEHEKSLNTSMMDFLKIHDIPKSTDAFLKFELFANMIQGSASLFTHDLVSKALPFPRNIKFHDYWLALNACTRKGCVYYNKSILSYRRHSSNVTEYQKFNLIRVLKKISRLSKDKKTYYIDNINVLENLKYRLGSSTNLTRISEALVFYKNLSNNTHRLKTLLYYIIHYKSISRSNYINLPVFFFRIFTIAVFGIKY